MENKKKPILNHLHTQQKNTEVYVMYIYPYLYFIYIKNLYSTLLTAVKLKKGGENL